jgi:hypothetical protein
MSLSLIQPSFARGEIGPELAARTDLAAYQTGLAKCINFIVSPYGGVMNRAGTMFLDQTPDNEVARLIRFKFNFSDTYCLEFTHLKMRLYRNGGLVLNSAGPNIGQPFELVTPYTRDQLKALNYTQSADVMDIVHPSHKPAKLRRFGNDNWTLTSVSLVPSVAAPASATATADAGGSSPILIGWRYQVTAVIDDGGQISEESLPVTSNSINVKNDNPRATITWPAVTGATYYHVYKDNAGAGIYGFIGRATATSFTDVNIAPTKTDTPPSGTDPFIGAGNYPRAVAYFQQRLCYASTDNSPQTLWFSRTGVFNNFGFSFPLKDDDSIVWTIASTEVNRINHLTPLRSLMTFTDGAEWLIQGQATGLTSKTINGDPQTYNGIGQLRPLVMNDTALYAQERGRTVTAFGYSLQADGFNGEDVSILSPQMLQEYSLADWDFQKIPYSIVWGARTDGQMVGITYLKEQQVVAWHRHVTDGKVLSVCSVPEGRQDSIYLCVERMIGGEPVRYVERMAERQLPRYQGESIIADSWFLDCALRYDGRNTSGVTMTLSGGTTWKYPEQLTLACSNASQFSAGDVGDDVQYLATPIAEPLRMEIVSFISGGVVTVRPKGEVPEAIRAVPFTSWAIGRDSLAGLDHLEGREVIALADGNVVDGLTVTGGAISLSDPGAVVLVGLPYESELQTLEVNVPGQETISDKAKIIKAVTAVLLESRGGFYGSSSSDRDLWEFKPRQDSDDYGAIQPLTGKATQIITDSWRGNGQLTVVQRDPLPLNILALIPRMDAGGAY